MTSRQVVISAGEALIDFSPVQLGGETLYLPRAGGSPYNVAIGLGRLGVPAGFCGRISSDAFGRLLRRGLEKSRVSPAYLSVGSEPSSLAFVHLEGGEAEYAFYSQGTASRMQLAEHLPELPDQAVLHFGSISLVLEPVASTLEGLMQKEAGRRFISLDPNIRPALIPDRQQYLGRLERWLGLVNLVKASEADIKWLYPGESVERVAERWLEHGPACVLVTLGSAGAFGLAKEGRVYVEAPQVNVVDTVGAGDAFMSGTLAWLQRAGALAADGIKRIGLDEIKQLLRYASRLAALTCERAGADPPWDYQLT